MSFEMSLGLLAILLFMALVYEGEISSLLEKYKNNESVSQLEWLKETVHHASFYGSALAAWLGFRHDSVWTSVIAVMWFISGLWYSKSLAAKVAELEEHEGRVRHRKMAGMVRSVVQSEIEKSKRTESG